MSEESDSSDSEVITVHKLPWRSPSKLCGYSHRLTTIVFTYLIELVDWMNELDRRYKNKLQKKTCSTPSKPRVIGTVSSSPPPSDAPQWAIDSSWRPSGSYMFDSAILYMLHPKICFFIDAPPERVDTELDHIPNMMCII